MPTKKRRLALDDQANPSTTARVSLTSLPIEIIAEILLFTCSPPTVLAVSRTCSFLYHSLAQNPDASFIWRRVRKTCKPIPLPDPGDGWKKSEADYVAFVFGGGVCEVCRKPTRAMYMSFAARIRLCSSWHCRKKYLSDSIINVTSELQRQDRQSLWMPPLESIRCFYPSRWGALTWTHGELLFRKPDWEEFRGQYQAYKEAEQAQAELSRAAAPAAVAKEDQQRERVLERCRAAKQRFLQIMEVSTRLIHWKWEYDLVHKFIKSNNDTWTKKLAEREGWDLEDLIASQTYGSLQRRKNLLLEMMELRDVTAIRSAIESELLTLQARHRRQKAEAIYEEKLTEVKKIYERMRCGTLGTANTGTSGSNEPWVVPPLSVFCALPSIRTLKGSPDPSALPPTSTSLPSDISSSLAISLITTDVHNWLVPIEKHLMTLLGYPNGWQSASKLTVPPLKRVTARFFCRQCGEGKVSRAYQRERCLDFRGVCSHVCVARPGKSVEGQRRAEPEEREIDGSIDDRNRQDKGESKGKQKSGGKTSDWNVDVFEKDEKAISLIKTILNLTGLSEENSMVNSALKALGGTIQCMTCKGWIVMDFDTAVGHAHRHESMQFQLLPTSGPSNAGFLKKDARMPDHTYQPISTSRLVFERGMTALLLGPSYHGRNLCKKVNYGCKHCFVVQDNNVVAIEKAVKGKGPRPMDFNALRSHVKEKHGIQDICDEDFFCYTSIPDGKPQRRQRKVTKFKL